MNHRAKHLQEWVEKHPDLSKGMLTPGFNNEVIIVWEDGSHLCFKYAFLVKNEETEEIGVFTEHCGYHVFSTRGLKTYEMLKKREEHGC